MDDNRLSNLLFLAGVAALAMPGCGGVGEPTGGGRASPSGNPLAKDNSLAGSGDEDVCAEFASRMVECGDQEYYEREFAEYAAYCRDLLDYQSRLFGEACGEASAELFACVAAQDCQSFACFSQDAVVKRVCGQGNDFGTTGF